ncbi:50S ribosomal protein L30 [Sulfolobus sp. A20]|uniref:50S ribosomal protein L30 n=2 Tax=Sulfolobaceae TaxID=118883 RepID=UPI000845E11C|nr:50S ribosomal protein L30 [Sulfolobus sp. A20]TRM74740.1 50S ribosomal protein L30 [Sulfolobus sp. B5]TRM74945.1 50S ribosomal protein L30 [Sulfolobus sp. A20-N-F8]TRM80218.1 50S ribosomal protein L30 [Sulfolobus sp. D5]TRM86187.1 50S ribosomal protein L30 [Sulfolobus sp. E3]TRM87110.1 50S ribosomal protein L30 [Sulfolobus sp. C3]TRN01776.1 50S ribosomal protein L30 [Sulfolobus sp. E1]TRN02519.1 50S ribosomal protein L30 [Sulfolobus sp. F1]
MAELLAIVRIRGWAKAPWFVNETLNLLRLKRNFNAMIYPRTSPMLGMLQKASTHITWGEITEDTLKLLLINRLRTRNGEKVSNEYLRKVLKIEDIETFSKALYEGKLYLHKLDEYFDLPLTLHPPKGGFKGSVKRPYKNKGEFGYRGKDINQLLRRMV